jgi:predicted phage-related endonuclease
MTVGIGAFELDLDRYCALNAQISELETLRDEIANRVKQHLGEAGKGDSVKYRVSWKTSERKTLDSKRLLMDHPNIDASSYYKTSKSRRFLVTQKG